MESLDIHRRKSLTAAFAVEVGNEIWRRFTVHFTPTHGSWLNQLVHRLFRSILRSIVHAYEHGAAVCRRNRIRAPVRNVA
jgi:hypothetical protein